METNHKAIAVIALILVALFAGGLFYVISENNNRTVALDLVQEYLVASPQQQPILEAEIRDRIADKPLAMTGRASFDSFEQLVANARACEGYAAQASFSPRDEAISEDEAWRHCMDHPEVLTKK